MTAAALDRATLYRWAMIVANGSGAISGARLALEKHTGTTLDTLAEVETDLDRLMHEMREAICAKARGETA